MLAPDTPNAPSRLLALLGIALAAPAFLITWLGSGFELPSPDDGSLDRLDSAMSLVFMAGAALIVAAIYRYDPSPLGRKGRWLLYVEAVMVVFAAAWALWVLIDPDANHDNVLLAIFDACWPLHQVFMLFVGIAAVRARRWPSPARYMLAGPAAAVLLLGVSAAVGSDLLAALALGAGWTTAGAAVLLAHREERGAHAGATERAPVTA